MRASRFSNAQSLQLNRTSGGKLYRERIGALRRVPAKSKGMATFSRLKHRYLAGCATPVG